LTDNFFKFKPANKNQNNYLAFKFKKRPDTQNDRSLCCFESDPEHSRSKDFLLKFNTNQDQRQLSRS